MDISHAAQPSKRKCVFCKRRVSIFKVHGYTRSSSVVVCQRSDCLRTLAVLTPKQVSFLASRISP